jgi:hypothetical protein
MTHSSTVWLAYSTMKFQEENVNIFNMCDVKSTEKHFCVGLQNSWPIEINFDRSTGT